MVQFKAKFIFNSLFYWQESNHHGTISMVGNQIVVEQDQAKPAAGKVSSCWFKHLVYHLGVRDVLMRDAPTQPV